MNSIYLNLDDDKREKGYILHKKATRENLKPFAGREICYVTTKDIDKYRGVYEVQFGTIKSVNFASLDIIEQNTNKQKTIYISDIIECAIK